jgi:hypothetical protein
MFGSWNKTLLVIVLLAASLAMAISVQAASARPYLWNYKSPYYVPVRACPSTLCNPTGGWARNGTVFAMRCWVDYQWATGNYRSPRWFWGQSYHNGYWGYVHSSYVQRQVTVPRC